MTAYVVSGVSSAQGESWMGHTRDSLVEVVVDLSRRTLAPGGFVTGDTIKLMDIQAGTLITNLIAQVVTVEGAAATVSLGDSGSATRYLNAVSTNSAVYTAGTSASQLYTAADYLLLTLGGTLNGGGAAKLSVVFRVCDVSNRQSFPLF